jgi:hypothetical protein
MSDKMRKKLQERFNRLKKALKKALSLQREETMPELVLQPIKNRQRYER